jgi:hypothetical protein
MPEANNPTDNNIMLSRDTLEIKITKKEGKFISAHIIYKDQSRGIILDEKELLFIYESLRDYFNMEKTNA